MVMNRRDIIKKRKESEKKLLEIYSKEEMKNLIKECNDFIEELKKKLKSIKWSIKHITKTNKKFRKRLKVLEKEDER